MTEWFASSKLVAEYFSPQVTEATIPIIPEFQLPAEIQAQEIKENDIYLNSYLVVGESKVRINCGQVKL